MERGICFIAVLYFYAIKRSFFDIEKLC